MSITIKCDICDKELGASERTLADLPQCGVKEVCPTCLDGLRYCIELAKVGPFWEQAKTLHKNVYSKRMTHLRNNNELGKR